MEDRLLLQTVKQRLRYDKNTGDFIWKDNPSHPSKNGTVAGYVATCGRRIIWVAGSRFLAHRLVWFMHKGKWPVGVIDHINGKPLDNRVQNLRDVDATTNRQNQRKASKGNSTGYLGVRYDKKTQTYFGRLTINGKETVVGWGSKSPFDAHVAYVMAKREHHKGNTL